VLRRVAYILCVRCNDTILLCVVLYADDRVMAPSRFERDRDTIRHLGREMMTRRHAAVRTLSAGGMIDHNG